MRWMSMTAASIKALLVAIIAGHGGSSVAQDLSADDRAWEAVKASGSAEACQQYLSEFPTGAHAEEAFRCLVEGIVPEGASNQEPASVDIY